ncbi:MAG: acyl-[acyl-carrier-protein] thioesterase [Actinomycetota bacterium]
MASSPPEVGGGLVPRPASGRVFEESRRVRLADVSPGGRLRLDAATRFLQDLSADDTADAALPDAESWVVRKTVIEVHAFPRYLEALELATWCSGTGSHWAERRISLVGEAGGHVEAATTWVHVDQASGRPKRVPPTFHELYGEAAGGRRVNARLELAAPSESTVAGAEPWVLRFTDFDVLSHVNNAAYWEVVEEVLASRRSLRAPLRAELEHRLAIERGADVTFATCDAVFEAAPGSSEHPDGLMVWVLADGEVAATARVSRRDLWRPDHKPGG